MSGWMILVGLAGALSAAGFKKFVWFISIGYAFAISGMSLAIAVLFAERLTVPVVVMLSILFAYSMRLGIFILLRERKNAAYKKVLAEVTADIKKVPFFVSLAVWIVVSLLYFAQISPIYFRLSNNLADHHPWLFSCGIAVSLLGFSIETAADYQKSKAKKINPKRFCDTGLFAIVRCPNYFGEMLVWTGVFAGSVTTLLTPLQKAVAIAGYVGIIFVMFNGARRLEQRQDAQYGNDSAYVSYVKKTPILIPFVPLYSLKRWKFLG
ncbi:MAG: DUF1295 domain-containing protein [Spirochaetia bacterium]|nr:DUF1295 domain-containing protein [Spirochaetia bacterium]